MYNGQWTSGMMGVSQTRGKNPLVYKGLKILWILDLYPHKNITTKFCFMPIMNWVSQLEKLTLFHANITKAQTSLHNPRSLTSLSGKYNN